MSTRWASPSIGGTTKAALQASRGGIADCLSAIARSESPTATEALSFSGSILTARLRWPNSSHSGRPRKRRSFRSPQTNRGSCASLWPPILMATSFVSSMISGATGKRTTPLPQARPERLLALATSAATPPELRTREYFTHPQRLPAVPLPPDAACHDVEALARGTLPAATLPHHPVT